MTETDWLLIALIALIALFTIAVLADGVILLLQRREARKRKRDLELWEQIFNNGISELQRIEARSRRGVIRNDPERS